MGMLQSYCQFFNFLFKEFALICFLFDHASHIIQLILKFLNLFFVLNWIFRANHSIWIFASEFEFQVLNLLTQSTILFSYLHQLIFQISDHFLWKI